MLTVKVNIFWEGQKHDITKQIFVAFSVNLYFLLWPFIHSLQLGTYSDYYIYLCIMSDRRNPDLVAFSENLYFLLWPFIHSLQLGMYSD